MLYKIVHIISLGHSARKPLRKSLPWKNRDRQEGREVILPYFDTLRIHGGMAEVTVTQCERSSLSWKGWWRRGWPLEYQCLDGVLDIKILTVAGGRAPLRLSINSPSINSLQLDGSSFIQTKHALAAEKLEVHHYGDGELVLALNVNRVETNCQGMGRLSLRGKANYWRDSSGVGAQVNALGLFVTVA